MVDFDKIAAMYDEKTREGLNRQLAERDRLFFNHNGILLPGELLQMWESRITDKDTLLEVLHTMEMNSVRYGMLYLNTPTRQMIGLDAGCGAGGAGIMIHRSYGCKMEGFTLSLEQIKYAKEAAKHYGYSDKVQFFDGNMLELSRPDNHYDFIWAHESTEHAPDLNILFQEFARVAKPLSRLVIITMTAHDPEFKKIVDERYLTSFHNLDEYLKAAQAFGWSPAQHVDLTGMTSPYWLLRKNSEVATGTEEFLYQGLSKRTYQYHLFAFDLANL